MLARSLVFFSQVIALILLCVSRRWHNQSVSVVWSDDSTHTHTHTRGAVTRSRVVCFSTEISCVSSLDYCSGCQNLHRYTSSTRWHIHTHSIASPNQALSVLSLLLLLSLWSFTGVWFFIPFPFFNIPLPQSPSTLFLILCSFRRLSSHYHSLFLPHDPLFFTSLLSFCAQHASSLTTFCFVPLLTME